MILPSRQLWFISAAVAVVIATAATYLVSRSGGCADDRPALDERVGEKGKELGKARERAGESGDGETLAALRARRSAFAGDSEAQLVALAAEIERRATLPTTPPERIEQLRRDHVALREQRQLVMDSSEAEFEENLMAFETAVNTIREQLARLDGGTTP
jgi:hypothetical protein